MVIFSSHGWLGWLSKKRAGQVKVFESDKKDQQKQKEEEMHEKSEGDTCIPFLQWNAMSDTDLKKTGSGLFFVTFFNRLR